MATYYWYGGAGNWSDYANHWSTNSGNSPSAPAPNAPTSADNVIFDDNSHTATFTVTVDVASNCANFTCSITNTAKKMTLAGSQALNVYGSWSNPGSTLYAATYSGAITFASTTTGNTITTNAVTLTSGSVTFNGVGGYWTLGGALTVTTGITLTNGTFDTSSSNYAVTTGAFTSNNSNTRTLVLNSSTMTLTTSSATAFNATTSTNFTLTANSGSTLAMNGAQAGIAVSTALTFGNITAASATTAFTLAGSITCNNFTMGSKGSAGYNAFSVGGNLTVNGTLTLNASGAYNIRTMVYSSVLGTARTLSVGTLATITDIDFRDITAAGASSPWSDSSGTNRWGNCGGNSNITFRAGVAKYWVGGTANWATNAWSSSSGGAANTNDFPLAQDTATFDDATTASITVTMAVVLNIGTISFASRTTRAISLVMTAGISIYGSLLLSSQVTYSGTGVLSFSGQGGTQQIDCAGKTLTGAVTFLGTGTYQLVNNAYTIGSTLTTTLTSGSLDLNNLTLSTGIFASSNANTRSIAFGTGKIQLTGSGGSIWQVSNGTNFSCTGSKTVECYYTGATSYRAIASGDNPAASVSESAAPNIVITGNGTDKFVFQVSGTQSRVGNIDGTAFLGAYGDSTSGNRNAPPVVFGNVALNAASTFTNLTSANGWFFAGTGAEQTIDFAGITAINPVTFSGTAGVKLLSNLTVDSTKLTTLTGGRLNLNSFTLSLGTITISGSITRSIAFGTGGTVTVNGSGSSAWLVSGTNFTTTGTGTVNMASASAKTFAGGGATYSCKLYQGGVGDLTITGNNTFADIGNDNSAACSVIFTAGTNNAFSAFSLSGASGKLVTIKSSSAGVSATVTKSSGTVDVSYASIQDITATGGAVWQALASNGNVNAGNNSGWRFAPGGGSDAWYLMARRRRSA